MSLVELVNTLRAEDEIEAGQEAEQDDVDDYEVEAKEIDDGFCEEEFDGSGCTAQKSGAQIERLQFVWGAVALMSCYLAEVCCFPGQQDWSVCFGHEESDECDDCAGEDGREPVCPLPAYEWTCSDEVCYCWC